MLAWPYLQIRAGYFLLALLAFLVAWPLAAQEYIAKLEHYGVEHGLSHREVNHIFQDSRGFIWIATPKGLNRFDGYGFRQYTKEKDGLLFNNVQLVSEDAEGWLWLTGPFGNDSICLFDPERNEVLSFAQKFGKSYREFFGNTYIPDMLRADDGALWMSPWNSKNLIRYHPATGLQTISVEGLGNIRLNFISGTKTFWVSTEEKAGLAELDQQGRVLQRIDSVYLYGEWSISDHGFLVIKSHFKGTHGFIQYDLKGNSKPVSNNLILPFRNPYPALIFPFENTGMMVVHDRLVDPQRGVLASWEYPLHDEDNFLWRAYLRDREGRIWLGDDFGVYVLQIKKNRFQRYSYQKDVKISGAGNSFRGILATPQKLYANLEKFGCTELDLTSGQSRKLPIAFTGWGHFSLAFGKNDAILSCTSSGLYRLFPGNGKVDKIILDDVNTWTVCEGDSGHYWIGTDSKGLYTAMPGAQKALPFNPLNGFDALAQSFVIHIRQDKSGSFWVCANNGFFRVHPQKGVVARYWSGGKGEYYLPADYFNHFQVDTAGVFWLATNTGLLCSPSKTGADGDLWPLWNAQSAKVYTRASGFSNEVIYAVYEDGRDNLWLSTDYGIIHLEKKTGLSKTYLPADGITHSEFNRASHFQDARGVIYFGSLNGITAFQPNDFYENPSVLSDKPLEIIAFQQFNGAANKLVDRTSNLLRSHEIILHPNDRFFNLEFALLSYEEVSQIQYAWKIEGLDKDWHYQKERNLNYGGLPYGKYTLRIKAQGADGQWSGKELAIAVRALRPWYLQIWFLMLVAIMVVGGIFGYTRWRSRQLIVEQKRLEVLVAKATERIEKQTEALRHLDEVKSRFFANVSHELRTPLSLLLGPIGSVLKRNKLENQDFTLLKLAQMHGKQLLQLVNQILDLSKLENGKLELQEAATLLYPLLRRIVAAFESHAQQKQIQFVFQYRAEKNLQILLDAFKLETILNNLLSNAIKFTTAGGEIRVSAENQAYAIRITVSDSGSGIHPDDLPKIFERFYQSAQPGAPTEGGSGIGLALCRELTEIMGGTIWAESEGLGKGSRFFFEFPLQEVLGKVAVDLENEPDATAATESILPLAQLVQQGINSTTTLLIVEDNASLRDYLHLILSARYQIITAENGQEGIELLTALDAGVEGRLPAAVQRLPDLIISDIMMPVMDGFQLLERLKSDERLRQIPVVMLTARADMQDKLHALRIGVDDYLLKPFEEEELLVRIQTLLERYRERLQLPVDARETEQDVPSEYRENDMAWLAALESFVVAEAQNSLLSVSWVANRMHLSERQFQRRLKKLTSLSPNAYLNEVRLQEARRLLETGKVHSVKELAWAMNFRNEKYFARIFRARFGKNPSDLMR